MSWMRCGHVLMYFDAVSTEYVFDDGKGIHDYGSSYSDNCTLIEILHGMVHEATGYEEYADKMLLILANKLGVADKLRLDEEGNLNPLTFEEYNRLMDERLIAFAKNPDKWHKDRVAEAIKELNLDTVTKPKALHNSKGGEVAMPGDDKKEPAKTEAESNLPKYIDTAKRILKKDHNWKYLVGMIAWWLIAKLIYG